MRGGRKQAKLACGRPLDGRVRPPCSASEGGALQRERFQDSWLEGYSGTGRSNKATMFSVDFPQLLNASGVRI